MLRARVSDTMPLTKALPAVWHGVQNDPRREGRKSHNEEAYPFPFNSVLVPRAATLVLALLDLSPGKGTTVPAWKVHLPGNATSSDL